MYKLVARNNEPELSPVLRELGFSIQVYSPIASRFLVRDPKTSSSRKASEIRRRA